MTAERSDPGEAVRGEMTNLALADAYHHGVRDLQPAGTGGNR
jgi:hypothetical protein